MKKLLCVMVLLAACLVSAAKQKKNKNEIQSVAIRHTACYGRCPDYSIEINKNGIATYTGIRFTADSGVFTKKMGVKKAAELIRTFNKYRVDTCKDEYENRIADLPGVIFTIKYAGRTKTIRNAHFGPPVLAKLRAKMDSLTGQKTDEEGQFIPLDVSWHKKTGTYK